MYVRCCLKFWKEVFTQTAQLVLWCLDVCDVSGLRIVEVAHDFQQQIRCYVVEDLKLLNSYDT